MKKITYGFITCIVFLSCTNGTKQVKENGADTKINIPAVTVNSDDTLLRLVNGTWYYRGKTFSGTIRHNYPDGKIQASQDYFNGREEGIYLSFYPDGSKEAIRYYRDGEKDSTHTGWWPNGNLRYEYHFKKGVYEGDFKEWYVSGKPMKQILYHNGKESEGKGWRENGKLYMSFVMRDGRLYGQINPNLCYSLSNGKGSFRETENPGK